MLSSSFDDFLKEEGMYEEAQATAIKRVLTWQLQQAMEAAQISKAEMAQRMHTSRSHLDLLLEPDNCQIKSELL